VQATTLPAVLAPVISPFNAQGRIDVPKLLKQCQWLRSNDVGVAIFGTNSESNSISSIEKMEVLEKLVAGGLDPKIMMPGTGACSVAETVFMTSTALKAGCAGVLMLPPFYYKDVSDDGLFSYFSEVIEQVGDSRLQIYLYNIPPITKIPMSLALLERLIKAYPNTIAGMKDTSGDWSYTEAVLKQFAPQGFRVFAGNEIFLLRTMQNGGYGCISSMVNIDPRRNAYLAAHWQDSHADQLQAELDQVRAALVKFPTVPTMKAVIAHFSKDPEWARVRPPLVSLSAEQKAQMALELEKINFSITGL
jgi:4-hydroxy-tetrahydrodipicolinate synthase